MLILLLVETAIISYEALVKIIKEEKIESSRVMETKYAEIWGVNMRDRIISMEKLGVRIRKGQN